MKKILLSFFLVLSCTLNAQSVPQDSYENVKVGKITVNITNSSPGNDNAQETVLTELQIKQGDAFNQADFDKDLKRLSKKYRIVDPTISKEDGKLNIKLNITLRPTIVKFNVIGTAFKNRKILEKAELSAPMQYNQGKFYESITNIRDFLIKRGYFQADVTYKIIETPGTGEAVAEIIIHQGPLGHIHDIELKGFTRKEQKAIYSMIKSSSFNILTNWLTGSGVLKAEEQEEDQQRITQYMQNQGYIDAKVDVQIKEIGKDKLGLYVTLDRGPRYHFGSIKVEGNTLETQKALDKALSIKTGQTYSNERIYKAQENLKDLYTNQGYLDTVVSHELIPVKGEKYDVVFKVEESQRYKVGLVVVAGNKRTQNDVIYNSANITPGEEFDSQKIKQAQRNLQATGFFDNVSIYAEKNEDLAVGGDNSKYRNVMIELEERRTGSFHVSAGANSTASIFGEVSMSESNFDIHGLTTMWKEGLSALRGGGQFVDFRAMVAAKDKTLTLKWVNPYINNSLWRFGVDAQGRIDQQIADYTLYSISGGMHSTYPFNQFFSGGFKFRIKDSLVEIPVKGKPREGNIEATKDLADAEKKEKVKLPATITDNFITIAEQQRKNSGIVSAAGFILNYNSTNHPFVPSRGLRSNFETEFAGLVRNETDITDFPFLKFSFKNAYYHPLWSGATIKFRADAQLIYTLWNGSAEGLPLTEKFFYGGVETVRGYAPGSLGPQWPGSNPEGGLTGFLGSVEILQKVLPMLDLFVFCDTASLTNQMFKPFEYGGYEFLKFYTSVGFGVRIHAGQPLPFIIGYGYPFNPDYLYAFNEEERKSLRSLEQRVFFSMTGRF